MESERGGSRQRKIEGKKKLFSKGRAPMCSAKICLSVTGSWCKWGISEEECYVCFIWCGVCRSCFFLFFSYFITLCTMIWRIIFHCLLKRKMLKVKTLLRRNLTLLGPRKLNLLGEADFFFLNKALKSWKALIFTFSFYLNIWISHIFLQLSLSWLNVSPLYHCLLPFPTNSCL